MNTLSNWELGKRTPHISYVNTICEVYDGTPSTLGLEHLVRVEQPGRSEQEHFSDLPMPHDILTSEDLAVRLLVPVWQWNGRDMAYERLQVVLQQQIRSYDEMSQSQDKSVENPERRRALSLIAKLPLGIYGLTFAESMPPVPAEELLPLCAGGLTACWHLSKGSDLPFVQAVVSSYLPPLTTIVKQDSRSRKAAAGLTTQAHLLAGLLAMHLDGQSTSEAHYREAVKYSQIAEDDNLYVASLGWLGSIFRYAKRSQKALETYTLALPRLSQVFPLNRSRIYAGFAHAQAECGQKQDALRSLGRAHETFFREPEGENELAYLLYNRSSLILFDGRTHYYLGENEEDKVSQRLRYEKALNSFTQVDSLQPGLQISERSRLEFLNNQARTAFGLRDLEQSTAYLEQAIIGALLLGSEQRYVEAREIHQLMEVAWGDELKVKKLKKLFKRH